VVWTAIPPGFRQSRLRSIKARPFSIDDFRVRAARERAKHGGDYGDHTLNPEMREMSESDLRQASRAFCSVESLEVLNPRVAHDPVLRQWWGRARRLLLSPEAAFDYYKWGSRIDVDPLLSSVRVPTLVLHRRDNRVFDIEMSRLAAAKIRDARFVGLPGSETDLFLGDTRPVLAAIRPFLEDESSSAFDEVRPLATVLFTDIVSSTEQLAAVGDSAWRRLLDDLDHTTVRIVAEHRGRVVKQTGDGILATFDGPARAVRCATELLNAAAAQNQNQQQQQQQQQNQQPQAEVPKPAEAKPPAP